MTRFSGRVVVVTGASRGLGQAIAVAFAREGATVVGVARSSQASTASQAREAGGRFLPIEADLSQDGQPAMADLVAKIIAETGRIDVLVNNAGIIRRAPAVEFSEKDWDDVLRTNLTAPFFLTQAVVRGWLKQSKASSLKSKAHAMEATEAGSRTSDFRLQTSDCCGTLSAASRLKIIFIASLLSFQGGILVPAYTASKHGIAGITKALANEWASLRINVNAIAPGYIATEATSALREDAKRRQAILERIPEGRWGEPSDIAGGCLFLASNDADFLNGAILNIDGGWLAR